MKLKRREDPKADPDMTPMIDMVFLLLIFFMVAATMSQVDLTPELRLPVAPKASVPEDLRNRGVINIFAPGYVTADGTVTTEELPFMVSGRLVDAKELTRLIEQKRAEDPALRVYMRVDRGADFKYVRRAIQSCAAAGVFDVIFATYQSASGG